MADSGLVPRNDGSDDNVIQFPSFLSPREDSGNPIRRSHPSQTDFQPEDEPRDHNHNNCTACDHDFFVHNNEHGCFYQYYHPSGSTTCRCPKFRS
jgi:hypothetical protein